MAGATMEIAMEMRYESQKFDVLAFRIRDTPTGRMEKAIPTRGEIIPKRETERMIVKKSGVEECVSGSSF